MRNPISRFVAFLFSSRFAVVLLVVHFLLVVYAIRTLPLANPNYWGSGGGCHGVPVADRVFFFCDATGILPVVGVFDFIGVVLFALFATFFWWLPTGNFHMLSWAVAVVLLIVTSLQWMLVGAAIERLLRWRSARRAHV